MTVNRRSDQRVTKLNVRPKGDQSFCLRGLGGVWGEPERRGCIDHNRGIVRRFRGSEKQKGLRGRGQQPDLMQEMGFQAPADRQRFRHQFTAGELFRAEAAREFPDGHWGPGGFEHDPLRNTDVEGTAHNLPQERDSVRLGKPLDMQR